MQVRYAASGAQSDSQQPRAPEERPQRESVLCSMRDPAVLSREGNAAAVGEGRVCSISKLTCGIVWVCCAVKRSLLGAGWGEAGRAVGWWDPWGWPQLGTPRGAGRSRRADGVWVRLVKEMGRGYCSWAAAKESSWRCWLLASIVLLDVASRTKIVAESLSLKERIGARKPFSQPFI